VKEIRDLPKALTPWAPYLQLLPEEHILAFAPLVQRLDIAIGPMRVQSRGGDGEPDGFDGISRRGTYDRLLLSEWMLADEIPDEFARRAVMSEHAFLQIARQEPAGARVSTALFDAGPNQLGAPRIAHLAALIVLARRVEAAGAQFEWGILQRPHDALQVGLSASGLAYLFSSRSAVEADEEMVAAWREQAHLGPTDEFWIVGGKRLLRIPAVKCGSYLILEDSVDPDNRRLEAEIQHSGRPPQRVTLDLPDDPACVRLMREPRRELAVQFRRLPVHQHAPTSNLLFLPGGTKLAARLSSIQLACYPVPNSPFSGTGRTRSIVARSRAPILAIGRFGKRYAVVTTTDEPQVLAISWPDEKTTPEVRFRLPEPIETPIIRDNSSVELLARRYDPMRNTWQWHTTIGGVLLRIIEETDTNRIADAEVRSQQSIALAEWADGLASVSYARDDSKLNLLQCDHVRVLRELGQIIRGYFGTGGVHDRRSLCAVELWDSKWHLIQIGAYKDEYEDQIVEPAGGDVIGVYGLRPPGGAEMAVALLSHDRKAVNFWQQYAHGEILRTDSPIVQVAVSPYIVGGAECSNIAYLTKKGELGIHSINTNSNVLRLELGGAVDAA